MRMPGFDAESSIYKTTGCYRMGGSASEARHALLQPAISSRFGIPLVSLGSIFGGFDFDCYRDCASRCGSNILCQRQCLSQCTTF